MLNLLSLILELYFSLRETDLKWVSKIGAEFEGGLEDLESLDIQSSQILQFASF